MALSPCLQESTRTWSEAAAEFENALERTQKVDDDDDSTVSSDSEDDGGGGGGFSPAGARVDGSAVVPGALGCVGVTSSSIINIQFSERIRVPLKLIYWNPILNSQ